MDGSGGVVAEVDARGDVDEVDEVEDDDDEVTEAEVAETEPVVARKLIGKATEPVGARLANDPP